MLNKNNIEKGNFIKETKIMKYYVQYWQVLILFHLFIFHFFFPFLFLFCLVNFSLTFTLFYIFSPQKASNVMPSYYSILILTPDQPSPAQTEIETRKTKSETIRQDQKLVCRRKGEHGGVSTAHRIHFASPYATTVFNIHTEYDRSSEWSEG